MEALHRLGPRRPGSRSLKTTARLQRRLSEGEISLAAFNRDWRVLDRPMALAEAGPNEDRLRRARDVLADFGSLWRDVAVPDVLREGAATEIFERLDVRGSELVAVHPRPNENAWLLGYAPRKSWNWSGREGLNPPVPTAQVVVPQWIGGAL